MPLFIPSNITPSQNLIQVVNQKTNFSNNQVETYEMEFSENIEASYEGPKIREPIDRDFEVVEVSMDLTPDFNTGFFIIKIYSSWTYRYVHRPYKWAYNIDYTVQINNDPSLTIRTKEKSDYNNAQKEFNSSNFGKKINYQNIKSLSVILWIGGKKCAFTLKFNGIEERNKHFVLPLGFDRFSISVQSGLKMIENSVHKKFRRMTFEPIKLKQNANNQKLLNVFANVDGKPFERSDLSLKKISNIPLSAKQDKKHEFTPKLDKTSNSIFFEENSYYDLKKNETLLGAGPNSKPGYVIPYDYKETFYPSLDFSFNQLKDYKFTWMQKINKPYFEIGNKNSLVQLNLKNDNDPNLVAINDWNNIEYDFFTKEENREINYQSLIDKTKNKNENKIL